MHHDSSIQPFPVQFLQLFQALATVESHPAGSSPQPIERQALHQSRRQSQPGEPNRFPGRIGKSAIFQPLRRADGSNLLKSAALPVVVVAASILFQARSRTPESPVATSSAASGAAMRALSGTGPQTIMKKS